MRSFLVECYDKHFTKPTVIKFGDMLKSDTIVIKCDSMSVAKDIIKIFSET